MVWKSVKVVTLICMLAAILAQPIAASAVSYTAFDGNISSSYTTIFKDIVGKIGVFDDYVFFRSGQYEYVMIAGDLSYENGRFTAGACTEYRIDLESNYNSRYVYSRTELNNFSLAPGNALVYSNLGGYPELFERGDKFAFASLLLLLIFMFMSLVRSIFSFTLRKRS